LHRKLVPLVVWAAPALAVYGTAALAAGAKAVLTPMRTTRRKQRSPQKSAGVK
jgi:hypothetical protein